VGSFQEYQRIPISTHVASSEGREPVQDVYSVQEWVIGVVLLQEEDGKEFSVAYMSQHLLDAETWYVFVEKLCLSLYNACSKFRHYILSSSCIATCQYDVIQHMLLKPILSGRMGKWAYVLVECDLANEPLRSMKGQVVADFIVDHAVDVDPRLILSNSSRWGCILMVWFIVRGSEPGVWLFPLVVYT
jgi:hypothetical protein